jgi:drug/metabolite transporter (DMT)-like permease
VPTAYVVLLVSNLIFATGYSISRIVLEDISPVTLAMVRLAIGSLILVPWAWRGMKAAKLSREDHWRLGLTGVVGFTLALAPHWRGDLVLILSGVAYAAYSLIARPVLLRQPALVVTAYSVVWGAAAMVPVAVLEWATAPPSAWTSRAIVGVVYLGVVMTALG